MARFVQLLEVVRANDVNLMSAAGTLTTLLPSRPGLRFLPLFVYGHLRTMTGAALTTGPQFKIGSNAAHTNVAPAFTVPTSIAVNVVASVPLATNLQPPSGADVVFELISPGVGPTTMVADFLLIGVTLD